MITPEQVPDEVVDAAVAMRGRGGSMRDIIRTAINAWPNIEKIYRSEDEKLFTIIIPLNTENTNDQA
jgi:hypothetical protein